MSDPINHPSHYTSSPAKCSKCGHPIECIDITRHMPFNIGNAVKYLWRYLFKGVPLVDLGKSVFYIQDEMKLIEERQKTDPIKVGFAFYKHPLGVPYVENTPPRTDIFRPGDDLTRM